MESLEQIQARLQAAFPGAAFEILPNPAPSPQASLLVPLSHGLAAARFLRDDPALRLDYCATVSGVDWLDQTTSTPVKTRRLVNDVETEVEEMVQETRPGYMEVVYHLFSMALKHGPVVLRLRTNGRPGPEPVPSLTPVWRSCEFQEREVYDLYGVVFEGHPDLRRIFMWDAFKDHPMRRDYVDPDDFEYEPTPHDEVKRRAEARP